MTVHPHFLVPCSAAGARIALIFGCLAWPVRTVWTPTAAGKCPESAGAAGGKGGACDKTHHRGKH